MFTKYGCTRCINTQPIAFYTKRSNLSVLDINQRKAVKVLLRSKISLLIFLRILKRCLRDTPHAKF